MAQEASEEEIKQFPSGIQRYPSDLLRLFSGTSCLDEPPVSTNQDSGEIELSLGLSLGGCFGVDPEEKGLLRSSSIASLSSKELDFTVSSALTRASSLPTETDEGCRKRKELQSLRRFEAKRKRLEKQNSKSENFDEDMDVKKCSVAVMVKAGRIENGCVGLQGSAQFGRSVNGVTPRGLAGRGFTPISQGSIGSQGSSSSVVSDLESRPVQGFDTSGSGIYVAAGRSTIQSSAAQINYTAAATTTTSMVVKPVNCARDDEDPLKKTARRGNGMTETERNMMDEMPCVSTRGDGPNGRRIEGFLYKFRKGEEVRIVCVCHGSFLTPAEFVKHAGGVDVANPLRHIVVSPSPSIFL